MPTPRAGAPDPGKEPTQGPEGARVSEGGELFARWLRASDKDEREEAFRAIYSHFYPSVCLFFSRRGFMPEDAEDLGQETLLRIYDAIEHFRGEAQFERWIYKITENVYRNALRARSVLKRSALEVPLDAENVPDDDPVPADERDWAEPFDQALLRERQMLIGRAIEDLPPQMRRCLQLRLGQDMKYREIAEVLQISIQTVKAHLFQARQRLQLELRDYFQDIEF